MAIVRFKSIVTGGKQALKNKFASEKALKSRRKKVAFKSSPKNKGTRKDEKIKRRRAQSAEAGGRRSREFIRELKKIGPATYRP